MPDIISLIPSGYTNQCEVTGGRGELLWHTPKPIGLEFFNDKDSDIIRVHKTVQKMSSIDVDFLENSYDWILKKETFDKLKKTKSEDNIDFVYQYLYILSGGKRHSEIWKDTFMISKEGHKINPANRIRNIKNRIENVIFSNIDALEFIKQHDSDDTFMFLDPPYPSRERYYTVHDLDWSEMYNLLKLTKSKWMMVFDPTLSPRVGKVISNKKEIEYIKQCSEFAYKLSNEFNSKIFKSDFKINSVFKKTNFGIRKKEYHVVMNY
jgi:DNA adenine methylase